ncbi:MAG TPA: TIGR03435 family protein [Bryobacteraceae bacterium]
MNQVSLRAFSLLLTPFAVHGQAAPLPAFEVASIKLNRTGIRGGSMEFSKGGERFTGTNMPFGAYILVAYGITVRQLSGPGAFLSERYDIVAKADHPASSLQMLHMLQTLLADRFKLVVRRETREVPVYALTISKAGPRLHRSDPQDAGTTIPRTPASAGGAESRTGYTFKNESMPDFAWALTRMAGIGDRIVVERTGLEGNFDFDLNFQRDTVPTSPDVRDPAPREGPSIFSAIQEQLGLKLESTKAPVEFLEIEHVERPSEN